MKFYVSLLLFLCVLSTLAQNQYTSSAYNISFKTNQILEKYDTEMEGIIGWMNDDYAVDVDKVPIEMESNEFVDDPKYGAVELANDMDYMDLEDGGKVGDNDKSYYVITKDTTEFAEAIVYIGVIVDKLSGVCYEITVYCYDLQRKEGAFIMRSFELFH